ncbi:hypothetical protein ACFL1N_08345 [Thermodesulfobacteriota bacterium]
MKELEGLFNALFGRFILQEVLGKVIPGAILLFSLYIVFVYPDITTPEILIMLKSLSFSSWFILGSVSWIASYVIQVFGEFPRPFKLLMYYGPWIPDDVFWYKKKIRFNEVATVYERSMFQRLTNIKKGCGNNAISLMLSSIILAIFWNNRLRNIELLLTLFIGGVILLFMHRVHAKRSTWWLQNVLKFRGEPRDRI